MSNFTTWLIHQLFGSHAEDNLKEKVKTFLHNYLLSNPAASRDAAIAAAVKEANILIPSVLMFFPGWAAKGLQIGLELLIPKLVGEAYDYVFNATSSARAALLIGSSVKPGTVTDPSSSAAPISAGGTVAGSSPGTPIN